MELSWSLLLLLLCVSLGEAATVWTSNDGGARHLSLRAPQESECVLPATWEGLWYQFDLGELEISRSEISHKGRCVASRIDAHLRSYLFHYTRKSEDCWRCLLIFPHHRNVLKYKETGCQAKGSLADVCGAFYGDAPLHSLFRLSGTPETCPLRPPLNFTYSFYRGECRSVTSTVNACASAASLRFHYQACPESYKAESRVEDVECLAHWSEKRQNFFLGRIVNQPSFRPGTNFRCFVYDLTASGGRIGVSADATCKDLYNVDSAPTQLEFVRDREPEAKCNFAKWLRKADGVWESLGTDAEHEIRKHLWLTRRPGAKSNDSTALCISAENYASVHRYLVYVREGCTRGYRCIKAVRRTKQVVEVSRGALARFPDEACTEEFFTEDLLIYDTLLLRESVEEECPNRGRYVVHGCTEDDAEVAFGCTATHQLILNLQCVPGFRETLNCHGHWEEGGVEYLVVREQHTGKRSCYAFNRRGDGSLSMAGAYRHPCIQGLLNGVNGRRVYNASRSGVCNPVSAAYSASVGVWPWPQALLIFPAALLLLSPR